MSSTGTKPSLSHVKLLARSVLNKVASLRQSARNRSDTVLWRLFGKKPDLNAVSADAHVEARLAGATPAAGEKGGRLHVRIAFHYVPWRLKYLIETMAAAQALPFEEIDLWIDTNTDQLSRETARLPGKYQIAVWDRLDHPFKLTWMHRTAMQERLDDFDAFMYLEDDIIIPHKTMQRWLQETPRLAAHGFLPGFLRVEENHAGMLMLADYRVRLGRSCITRLDGRPYLNTPYPYQACWVYDAAQMRELAALPGYLTGAVEDPELFRRDGVPPMRERVALGLQFTAIPDGSPSRALIPLTEDLHIAPDALVFHAPSNYARRKPPHPAGLGLIPVSDIFAD